MANNVVMLNGAPIAIDEAALRRGRGTLLITLPPATPVGLSTVYFMCDGEKSNELISEAAPPHGDIGSVQEGGIGVRSRWPASGCTGIHGADKCGSCECPRGCISSGYVTRKEGTEEEA